MKYFRKPDYKLTFLLCGIIWVTTVLLSFIPGSMLCILTFGWFRYFDMVNDLERYLDSKCN